MSEANAVTKTQSDPTTRVACDTLLEGVKSLKEMLKNTDTDYQVEIGSILWYLGDAITAALNTVKKDLREKALTELGGIKGTATFDGTDLGTASVVLPKASLRVPKGKKIDDIKLAIGSDFSLFFEEVTTYKPRVQFDERVTNLTNQLHQQILLNAVERVEPTLRVSFRRNETPKVQASVSTPAPAVSGTDPASLLDD